MPKSGLGTLRNAGQDAPLGQGMGRAAGAKVVRRGTDGRTDGRTGSSHARSTRSGNMLFESGILLQRMMHVAC